MITWAQSRSRVRLWIVGLFLMTAATVGCSNQSAPSFLHSVNHVLYPHPMQATSSPQVVTRAVGPEFYANLKLTQGAHPGLALVANWPFGNSVEPISNSYASRDIPDGASIYIITEFGPDDLFAGTRVCTFQRVDFPDRQHYNRLARFGKQWYERGWVRNDNPNLFPGIDGAWFHTNNVPGTKEYDPKAKQVTIPILQTGLNNLLRSRLLTYQDGIQLDSHAWEKW